MKNIIIMSAASLFMLSGLSAFQNNQALSDLDVQIQQTKTPVDANMRVDETKDASDKMVNDSTNPKFVSDHDLTKAIYKAIRDDRIFSTDSKAKIEVTVFNGKVTLSGVVTSQAEKERAELLATQVNNLKSVVNNIKVVP